MQYYSKKEIEMIKEIEKLIELSKKAHDVAIVASCDNSFINDVLRQQIIAVRVSLQPVADKLFVVRGLGLACLVAFQRPETGAVGSQHLVADYNLAVFIHAEFKLGISDDDASGQRIVRIRGRRYRAQVPNQDAEVVQIIGSGSVVFIC